MARTGAPSTTRRTLHYFWLVTRKHIGLFAALMTATFLFVALLSYGNPYVMSLVVDRVSAGSVAPDEVFSVFGPYIAALILINVAGQAASKVQDYTMYRLEIAASYDLATMSFDALSNQSMSFHSNRFGGTLVSQTTKFMSAYQLLLETITFPFLPVICSVVFTCAILAPRVPVYVAILMVLLAVYAGVSYYMYKRILHLNEQAASAQNQLSGELSDSVANILAVKTYGREDYERGLFDQANREVVARDSKRMWASLTRGIVTACITIAIMSVVAVFIAGGNAWYGITPGTLVVMFTYTYTVTNQFNFINNGLQRFNRAFGDASGMTVILDEPRLVDDKPGAPELEVREGAIDFEGIDFWYTDGDACTHVFDDFELHIPAGQRVGLVGTSGAGKTTLTKLLLRLSDIQEGRILIDGQNIAETTQQSLRRQIAYVPQEALLFHRTIAENIAYGRPDATMEQIREAARQANALEFIERLPQGFDTVTGERGVKLSGPASAHRHRAGASGRLPGARAGRGHERARLRKRAAGARRAGNAHAWAHVHRGGTPPVHRGQPRPHRGARRRQGGRGRPARPAHRAGRRVREPLEPPDGGVFGRGVTLGEGGESLRGRLCFARSTLRQ